MYESFSSKKKEKKKLSGFLKILYGFLIKTLIVAVIFLISLIFVKKSDKNKEIIKKTVYKNSISFAKIYGIYKDYLGDVVPFKNIFKNNVKLASSDKISYEKIEKEGNGYTLTVSDDYALQSLKSGIVIETKKDDKYNNIIKIQDKNGLNITYGYLNDLNVKLYDYVEKGEILGRCSKKVYLIFEKKDKYLSYEKYL